MIVGAKCFTKVQIVFQLQKQFPLAFEFNEYYLRFVAYHTVSCRFRTFLLDSEAQRAELGITAADDKRIDTNRMVSHRYAP